jgi:hypothetical protein
MSMVVASLVFVILLAVSMAHLAWSFGLTYPIRDEKLLAQTVVGRPGIERMPPRWASFGIAVLTFAAGILTLSLADKTSGGLPLSLAALPAAAIFLARGAVGYTQWWASMTPEPNFRVNDRRVYSPLCLAIGAGFLLLFIMRLI